MRADKPSCATVAGANGIESIQMIRAVERALAIFDAFDAQHQSLSLLEIGARINVPKATTFRLVNTLQKNGFLVRLEDQRYCLSLKLLRLSGLVKSTLGIRDTTRPIMAEVYRATGETVTLNIKAGFQRVCIDVVDTPSPLMSIARPGEHISLYRGAAGRLLLAYTSEAELNEILRQSDQMEGVDPTELKAHLADIRTQALACTAGQRIPGITAIAVPIFDIRDEVHYCLSLSGPSIRMDPRLDEFQRIMIEAGKSISSMMGTSYSSAVKPEFAKIDEAFVPRKSLKAGAKPAAASRRTRKREPA